MSQVRSLIKGPSIEVVLTRRRRGCAGMVHQAMGAEAVILPRSHRTSLGLRDHHGPPYQDRHLVGRVLSRLPSFTRMANRDDGLARNCLSLLTLVCAEI